jgi:hypothetical protein
MLELEWNKISLTTYSSNKEILSLLVAQLSKDFESCKLAITIPFDASAPLIQESVFKALQKDTHSTHTQIQQLLYRIDVSEKLVEQIEDKNNLNQFIQSLTELIIKRELQKVLIRKYYH